MELAQTPKLPWRTTQGAYWRTSFARIEAWLELERDRIGLWLPIALGFGIAAWMLLPNAVGWTGFILIMLAIAGFGGVFARGTRIAQMCRWGGIAAALGCALIWWKADYVAAPVLGRPVITLVDGTIETVEPMAARAQTRLVVAQTSNTDLPPRMRISVPEKLLRAPIQLAAGQRIRIKARLMPPPQAALPGGYNFAQRAWFDGIGAVGSALSAPEILSGAGQQPQLRNRLSAYIQTRLTPDEAGIAVALAAGDQGAIAEADAEAMRQSGLAHLLSISGLHVTAFVGAAMLLALRLMALSPALALRLPLVLFAAAIGAGAGIFYTWISGAQVPTVRSCIAAILVLAALGMGRDALTMRLLAVGAIVILLLKPESLFGPSFQLSFAAIAAIMALHEYAPVQRLLERRDEAALRRFGRNLFGLLLTGVAVEIILMPVALFHFHKAGIYGALANLIAIPLTTFVIMPLEAAALLLDGISGGAGFGAPFWWLCGKALAALLWLAHTVSDTPGAVALVPGMGAGAFACIIAGALWLLMWGGRVRIHGIWPIIAGIILLIITPKPDVLITADGRHVVTRLPNGEYAMLRGRAGEFVRDMLSEASGTDEDMRSIASMKGAECSLDFCVWRVSGEGQRTISILASRSNDRADWASVVAACSAVDIAISDRWLPRGCSPKWIKADRKLLETTGGLAVNVDSGAITPSRSMWGDKPWDNADKIAP